VLLAGLCLGHLAGHGREYRSSPTGRADSYLDRRAKYARLTRERPVTP
jgi:hypothetical protein